MCIRDRLVCGRQEILDDNGQVREYYYKSADADVYGYTMHPYEDWISSKMTEKKETGNKHKRYFLQVLNWRLVTPALHAEYASERSVTDTRQFCLQDSFYLPVYFETYLYEECQTEEKTYSKTEAAAIAQSRFEQYLVNLEEKGIQILEKNVMIEKADQKYVVTGTVDAYESIVSYQPTEILEITSEERQQPNESD